MCFDKVVPTKISTLPAMISKIFIITSEIFHSSKILKLSHCKIQQEIIARYIILEFLSQGEISDVKNDSINVLTNIA